MCKCERGEGEEGREREGEEGERGRGGREGGRERERAQQRTTFAAGGIFSQDDCVSEGNVHATSVHLCHCDSVHHLIAHAEEAEHSKLLGGI